MVGQIITLLLLEAIIHIAMEKIVDTVPPLRQFCREHTMSCNKEEINRIVTMRLGVRRVCDTSKGQE